MSSLDRFVAALEGVSGDLESLVRAVESVRRSVDRLGSVVEGERERVSAESSRPAPVEVERSRGGWCRPYTTPSGAEGGEGLGCAIRNARIILGINQSRLASLVGTDQSRISMWERGVCHPDATFLLRLKRVLPALFPARGGSEGGSTGSP